MKNPEEIRAYFRSMPKKEKKNPYWEFDETLELVQHLDGRHIHIGDNVPLLTQVRSYFRSVYESFGTETQVLCVTDDDKRILEKKGIPNLGRYLFDGIPVWVMVLPQVNTPVNTIISETFWQKEIVDKGIMPVVRIHSHHRLDAYQSSTDYSTLNSNTLEMVMGHINEDLFQVAYWLDQHGKDTKSHVFHVFQNFQGRFLMKQIACGNKET